MSIVQFNKPFGISHYFYMHFAQPVCAECTENFSSENPCSRRDAFLIRDICPRRKYAYSFRDKKNMQSGLSDRPAYSCYFFFFLYRSPLHQFSEEFLQVLNTGILRVARRAGVCMR